MNCPLCGESRLKNVLASKKSAVIKCRSCGFMFRDPYAGCAAAKCAACADRCIDHLADPAFLEARLRVDGERVSRIKKLTGKNLPELKVLELGTGLGCLAVLLSGSAGEYLGTEPSPVFYSLQHKNFKELSGKVINSILPGAEHAGRFDLVVAVDVLQFAEDPLKFIARSKNLLKKGGLFYLEVPNESRLGLRAGVRKALGLYRGEPVHHGHINFFTGKSLRFLLETSGLKIEKLGQTSIAGNRDRLFLTLKKELPLYLKAVSTFTGLTKADLPLGLGNTVCVCSKPA